MFEFLPFAGGGKINANSTIAVPCTSAIVPRKALRIISQRTSGTTTHYTKCNSSCQSKGPGSYAIPYKKEPKDANLCRQSPDVFDLCHDLTLHILKALARAFETGIWPPSPVSDV